MSASTNLTNLGLSMPPAPKPLGCYKPLVYSGNLAFLSGHGPVGMDGKLVTGRLGGELSVEEGYAAARLTGLNILATLNEAIGSLDKISRIVKVFGMVQCTNDFTQQPAVINGCSELFRDVFGDEIGIAARSAIGVPALPGGMCVEIEAVVEL